MKVLARVVLICASWLTGEQIFNRGAEGEGWTSVTPLIWYDIQLVQIVRSTVMLDVGEEEEKVNYSGSSTGGWCARAYGWVADHGAWVTQHGAGQPIAIACIELWPIIQHIFNAITIRLTLLHKRYHEDYTSAGMLWGNQWRWLIVKPSWTDSFKIKCVLSISNDACCLQIVVSPLQC